MQFVLESALPGAITQGILSSGNFSFGQELLSQIEYKYTGRLLLHQEGYSKAKLGIHIKWNILILS